MKQDPERKFSMTADGSDFELKLADNGEDVVLIIEDNEPVYMSSATATILAMGLLNMVEVDDK